MKRMMRWSAGWVVVLLMATTARAQEPAYQIERLEIRGLKHVSQQILLDETRMVPGATYGEQQLREAIDRIRRLPFILDAQPSLEKGSSRGSYVLVITVEETRPVFYLSDFIPTLESSDISRDPVDSRAAVGARFFLGARSMVHAGALTRYDDRPHARSFQVAQIGFTQFGLFGGRAFATVTLNKAYPGGGQLTPGLVAGTYLGSDRTLTLIYDELDSDYGNARRERLVQMRLARNTTDDPFYPTRGSLLAIAPTWIDVKTEREQRSEGFGIESELSRYWTVSEHVVAGLDLEGGYLDLETEESGGLVERDDQLYGSARIRLSYQLTDEEESESRLEVSVRRLSDRADFLRDRSGYDQLSVAWTRRDAWGMVRVGVGYAW